MRIKYFKRELSIVLILSILLTSIFGMGGAAMAAVQTEGSAEAAGEAPFFHDISGSYAKKEIETLASKGILSGYEDGSFGPAKAMTRAEFAKVLAMSARLKEEPSVADKFRDIASDSWYKGFVGAMVKAGITVGTSNESFSPDSPVTREQLAVFFVRALGLEEASKQAKFSKAVSDLADASDWAKDAVRLAFEIGFLQGAEGQDGAILFLPKQNAERQALARLAYEFVTNKDIYIEKANVILGLVPMVSPSPSATPSPSPSSGSNIFFPGGGGTSSTPTAAPVAAVVVDARAIGTDKVEVEFDKAVASPEAADFTFEPNLAVTAASLKSGNDKVVVLTTAVQTVGSSYSLKYKGAATNKTITGTVSELSALEVGVYEGNYRVARGVTEFGPATGTAVINGTLQLDPGADKELELRNVEATNVQVLSGASHSIKLMNIKIKVQLIISAGNQSDSVRIVALGDTAVARTSVESKAILDSQSGTLGDIDLKDGAAGAKVELRGNFDGKVSVAAQGVTLAVSAGATVASIEISSNATLESDGNIDTVQVTASIDLTLQGIVTGTVTVTADNASLEIAEHSTVSKVDLASNSRLNSKGSVTDVVVTAKVKVELDGIIDGSVTVTANEAELFVGEHATVGVIELQASAYIETNGSIGSMELKSDDVVIVLKGTKKGEALDKTLTAAVHAIRDLPAVSGLKLSDRSMVKKARGKVLAAKALNSEIVIDNLAKLEEAETQIKQLAMADALLKLAALPSQASTIGLTDREEAAVLLKAAKDAVLLAKSEGVTDHELAHIERVAQVEQRLDVLKELSDAIIAANTALSKLPRPDSVTLAELSDAIAKVNIAETAKLAAEAKGAEAEAFLGLDNLEAVKSKVAQLQEQLDEKAKAVIAINGAIMQLPSREALKLADKALVEQVRKQVNEGIANYKIAEDQLMAIPLLKAVEARLAQLIADKNTAVQTAVDAIAGLPDKGAVTLGDKDAVYAAHAKVEAAKRVGAVEEEISNVSRLKDLLGSLQSIDEANQAAVQRAVEAIKALPALDKITGADETKISDARQLVKVIQDMGVSVGEVIGNLMKLNEAEKKLAELQRELLNAIRAANEAIAALPAPNQLTLADTSTVASARSKVDAVVDMGVGTNLIENVQALVHAEARIAELLKLKDDSVTAAVAAIASLPAAADITLAQAGSVVTAREMVNNALANGAVESDIAGFAKLVEAENRLRQLYDESPMAVTPTLSVEVYEGELAAYGFAEPGGMIHITAGEQTRTYEISDTGYFFFYDEGIALVAGQVIEVVSSVSNKRDSLPLKVAVKAVDGQSATPQAGEAYLGDWMLSGTTPSHTYLKLTTMDGAELGSTFVNGYSSDAAAVPFTMNMIKPEGLPNEQIKLVAHTFGKSSSEPLVIMVNTVNGQTSAAMVNVVYETDNRIYGTTEPNALLKVTDDQGNTLGTSAAYAQGLFKVWMFNERDFTGLSKIYVTAKSPGKAASEPLEVPVAKLAGKTKQPTVTGAVYEGFLVIEGWSEPGASITVEGIHSSGVDMQPDGHFVYYTIDTRVTAGESLKLYSQARGKEISDPLVIHVVTGVHTAAPAYVRDIYEGDFSVRLEAKKNQLLALMKPTGEVIGWARTGNYYDSVIGMYARSELLTTGETVWVVAMTKGQAASEPLVMTVKPVSGRTNDPVIEVKPYLSAGMVFLKGQAEPDSDVIVKWGTGSSASIQADSLGRFGWNIGYPFQVGDVLSLLAKAPGKAASNPVQMRIKEATERTATPELTQDIYPGDYKFSGKSESSAMITVKRGNGQVISHYYANSDGMFTVYLSHDVILQAGETLSITATGYGKKESLPLTVQVQEPSEQTSEPKLFDPIYASSMFIRGAAEPDSVIHLINEAGVLIARTNAYQTGQSPQEGQFILNLNDWNRTLIAGETLTLTATGYRKLASQPLSIKVQAVTGITKLYNVTGAVYENGSSLNGQTEPYAYVTLTSQGLTTSTQASSDGYFMLNNIYAYRLDEQPKLIAVANGKERSEPVWLTVMPLVGKTLQPTVTGTVYEDGYSIDGVTTEPSSIEISTSDGIVLENTLPMDNSFWLDRRDMQLQPDSELLITARAMGKHASDPIRLRVLALNGITKTPTLTDHVYVYEDGYFISGFAEPGAAIEISKPDGTILTHHGTYDGSFYVDKDIQLPVDSELWITAKVFGKKRSSPVVVKVKPAEGLTPAPRVEGVIMEEDTGFSVNVPVRSRLTISLEDGTRIASINIDMGTTRLDLPGDVLLAAGDVLVLQTDSYGRLPSEEVRVTVTAAAYQTLKPVVYGSVFEGSRFNLLAEVEYGSLVILKKSDGRILYSGWDYTTNGLVNLDISEQVVAGESLRLTSKVSGKKTSETVLVTVKAPEGLTDAPVITGKLYEDEISLEGVAVPGAQIAVYSLGNEMIASTYAGVNGMFWLSLNSSVQTEIQVTAQSQGKLPSAKVIVPVEPVYEKTASPTVRFINQYQLQGFAEPGAWVTVKDNAGYYNNSTQAAASDGMYTLSIRYFDQINGTVQISAKASGKRQSDVVTVHVTDSGKTPAPYVRSDVYIETEALSVAGQSDSYITVTDENANQIGSGWIYSDGYNTVWLNHWMLAEGMQLSVTAQVSDATVPGMTVSDAVYLTVKGSMPPTATPEILYAPYDMLYGKAEPGASIQIQQSGSTYYPLGTVADTNGRFVLDIHSLSYGAYNLTAIAPGLKRSEPVSFAFVEPAKKTESPLLVGKLTEESTEISGITENGMYVEVKNTKGMSLGSATTYSGIFSIWLHPDYVTGGETLYVTAKARGKATSTPAAITVEMPTVRTSLPTVTGTVYEDSYWVSGTAEREAKVWIEDGAGNIVSNSYTYANWDENFHLDLKPGFIQAGDTLYVFAKKQGKQVSVPRAFTVASYGVRTVTASVYDDVYEEDPRITVHIQPNSYEFTTIVIKNEAGSIIGYVSGMTYDGWFTVWINENEPLQPNEKLYIYAKTYEKDTSLPFVITVKPLLEKTPTPAVTRDVHEGDIMIRGTVDSDISTLQIRDSESQNVFYPNSHGNGTFTFDLPDYVKAEHTLLITAKAPGKKTSDALTIKVLPSAGKTEATTVTGNVYTDFLWLQGFTEAGSLIRVRNAVSNESTQWLETSVQGGSFTFNLINYFYYGNFSAGTILNVTAKAPGKTESAPVQVVVQPAPSQMLQPLVDPVYEGDTVVTGASQSYAGIIVTRDSGMVSGFSVWDGSFYTYMNEPLRAGERIAVTTQLYGRSVSEAVYMTVQPLLEPTNAPRVIADWIDRYVIQSEPNAAVFMKDVSGIAVYIGYAGLDGRYIFDIDGGVLRTGGTVTFTAQVRGKLESALVHAVIPEASVTDQPTVTSSTYGDYPISIEGHAAPDSWIGLYQGDHFITSAIARMDGTFHLNPYYWYSESEPLKIIARQKGKAACDPVFVTI